MWGSKDRGSTIVSNVGKYLPDYTASRTRKEQHHIHNNFELQNNGMCLHNLIFQKNPGIIGSVI
jgi:hypothetical protein